MSYAVRREEIEDLRDRVAHLEQQVKHLTRAGRSAASLKKFTPAETYARNQAAYARKIGAIKELAHVK